MGDSSTNLNGHCHGHVHSGGPGTTYTRTTTTTVWLGGGRGIAEELRRAAMGKYRALMDLLGAPGGIRKFLKGGDLRSKLMILLQVVVSEIDESIIDKMEELKKVAQQLKDVNKSQHEESPGKIAGLNTDSSLLQAQLTALIQRRQQIVDAINNAIKSCHDTDMNTVRRIV